MTALKMAVLVMHYICNPTPLVQLECKTPNYLAVPMKRLTNGILCIPIVIDDNTYWFYIDTGSERTLVTKELAKTLGLKIVQYGEVSGIGATSLPAYFSTLPKMQLGRTKRYFCACRYCRSTST